MAELVAAAYVRGADVTETIATLSTAHITAPRTSGWWSSAPSIMMQTLAAMRKIPSLLVKTPKYYRLE